MSIVLLLRYCNLDRGDVCANELKSPHSFRAPWALRLPAFFIFDILMVVLAFIHSFTHYFINNHAFKRIVVFYGTLLGVLWWEISQDSHLSLLPVCTSLMFACLAHLSLSYNPFLYSMPSPCTNVHLQAQGMCYWRLGKEQKESWEGVTSPPPAITLGFQKVQNSTLMALA